MTTVPPRTPAEKFAAILLWLSLAVDGHSLCGRLARPLALLILDRIRTINQRFSRLATRIGAGRAAPRRATPPRRPTQEKPRRPDPLPQHFAWLVGLMPEAACFGSQLQLLLAEPEMAALLAAAPGPMGRLLRPLCRMLAATPPPILARPRSVPADASPDTAPVPPAKPRAPPRRRTAAPLPQPWVAAPMPALNLEFSSGRPRLVWN